ncbi:MAG TPA: Ig-like domain repeat protein [Acidimicrobiales bacterium]|jgi:hypothetical protein|nr:Ig-like domain repeat protein [Acidimicrobiales bacterium]
MGTSRVRRAVPLVAVLALSSVLLAGVSVRASAAPAVHQGTGLSTNYDFAHLVLVDGGWPVSANNVTVLTQWLRSEEPPTHWWNRDNPLNNGLGSGGGSGLGSYGSVVTAAYFVALNLQNSAYGYPAIASDLRASAPVMATDRAIWRSSWASGHYGRGARWGTSPVPSVPSPTSAWRNPTRCPIPYPRGVLGPCGRGFTTSGTTWQSGAPEGIRGQELWAFSSGTAGEDTASWVPSLAAGAYRVSAFLPALFSDANVTYVVTDASGRHRVLVGQEPFSNAWVDLGVFTSAGGSSVHVTLGTASRGPWGATYVAADAMRFARVAASGRATPSGVAATSGAGAPGLVLRTPGPPQDVTAVAGDGRATVAWLAPSKDGGAPISRFSVVSLPGHRACVSVVRAPGEHSCTVARLANGVDYRFVVRAINRAGAGAVSAPSSPVRPLGLSGLRLVAMAHVLQYGERVLYRVFAAPRGITGGSVLFAEDGSVVPGCQSARVVRGRASCALRLTSAARHVVLATYSGDRLLSGTQQALVILVKKAPSDFRAAPLASTAVVGTTVTLRAWHLPSRATGKVVFDAGESRLCVAVVESGGGTCTFVLHLPAGVHDIQARYVGDRDFLGSLAMTTLQAELAVTPPS